MEKPSPDLKLSYYAWTFVERLGANGVSFLGNVCLTYFVTTTAFGIVGALSMFAQIVAGMLDCGLTAGIMRLKSATSREFSTMFWFNVLVGLAIAGAYWLAAPAVSRWMKIPETCPTLRFIAIGVVFNALSLSSLTRIQYELKLRKRAMLNLAACVSGVTVALVLGYLGTGFWAVASTAVTYPTVLFLGVLVTGEFRIRTVFDRRVFHDLWRFGSNLLGAYMVTTCAQNIYTLVLVKYFTPMATGLFYQAQKLTDTPLHSLEATVSQPTFVCLAKLTDPAQLRTQILKSLTRIALVLGLTVCLLAAVATPLIDFIFPPAWHAVIPYFRALLGLYLVQRINLHLQVYLKIYGRSDWVRNLVVLENAGIIIFALTLYRIGILWVVGISALWGIITMAVFLRKIAGYASVPASALWGRILRQLMIFVPAGALAYVATLAPMPTFVQLVLGTAIFAAVALACMWCLDRAQLRQLASVAARALARLRPGGKMI